MKKSPEKPKKTVNHDSHKVRRPMIIGIVLVGLSLVILCSLVLLFPSPAATPAKPVDLGPIAETYQATAEIDPVPKNFTDNIADLLDKTNVIRAQYGLTLLAMDPALNLSAKAKCDDMVKRNYWDHKDPDGKDPYHFFSEAGASFSKAGENLAFGYNNAQQTLDGWVNSPTHKDNLVDPDYTNVGFAVCESPDFINQGKQIVIVQHLTRKS